MKMNLRKKDKEKVFLQWINSSDESGFTVSSAQISEDLHSGKGTNKTESSTRNHVSV